MSWSKLTLLFCLGFAVPALAAGQNTATIHNAALSVRVRPNDGAYEISSQALRRVILASRLGVEANHHWLLSTDYPRHQVTGSSFTGELGAGHVLTVTYTGLEGKPDLVCRLRLYDKHPYGNVAVQVHNTTGDSVTVNAIRVVDALGQPRLDL